MSYDFGRIPKNLPGTKPAGYWRGGSHMKKFRTAASVITMVIAGTAGFFIGATLDNALGGAFLFSMIAGIACVIYTIDNREK